MRDSNKDGTLNVLKVALRHEPKDWSSDVELKREADSNFYFLKGYNVTDKSLYKKLNR